MAKVIKNDTPELEDIKFDDITSVECVTMELPAVQPKKAGFFAKVGSGIRSAYDKVNNTKVGHAVIVGMTFTSKIVVGGLAIFGAAKLGAQVFTGNDEDEDDDSLEIEDDPDTIEDEDGTVE